MRNERTEIKKSLALSPHFGYYLWFSKSALFDVSHSGPQFLFFFELLYQFIVALALRFQADRPSCLGDLDIVDGDEQIILGH